MRQKVIEKHFREILKEVGVDISNENFKKTPKRIAKFYSEMFDNGNVDDKIKKILKTKFPTTYDGMVVEGPIVCYSMCPHHFLPVLYRIFVGYIPINGGLGLSKLPRLVELLAKSPKLQEDFTKEISSTLQDTLKPRGVMVVVRGEHLCMKMRGVKTQDCNTKTSSFTGVFENKDSRDEFMELIRNGE